MAADSTNGHFDLHKGRLRATVSATGGSIIGLTFDGTPLLVPAGGPRQSVGCFPMLPFGNRLEGNRFSVDGVDYQLQPNMPEPLYRHGDGWLADWQIEDKSDASLFMRFSRSSDAASPYAYTATQTIALSETGLTITLSITNNGAVRLPFGLGLHPFFVRTPETRLQTASAIFWHERDDHLPGWSSTVPPEWDFSEERPLPDRWANNGFEDWSGRARIVWPELSTAAEMSTEGFPKVMLYMPTARTDFFCLEPMTHVANGHHLPRYGGLRLLAPGEAMDASMTLHFSRLD